MPLGGLRGSTTAIEARWNWMKTNWDALYKHLLPGLGILGTVVQLCTSSFCTEEQLKHVQAFFEKKDTKGYDRAVEQSLDAIRAKIQWLKRDPANSWPLS